MVKCHGYAGRGVVSKTWNNLDDTLTQIEQTNGRSILLIRNPYNAIFGFRNHIQGGHFGHAHSSNFDGEGNSTLHFLNL